MAADRLGAGGSGQPNDPGVEVRLSKRREIGDGRGRRVARSDDQDVFASIVGFALAENIVDAVGDETFGGKFANGGDAAVTHPAMLRVCSSTVKDDISLLDVFAVFPLPEQKAKGRMVAFGIVGGVILEATVPTDVENSSVQSQTLLEARASSQGSKVSLKVLSASEMVGVSRKFVPGMVGADRDSPKRGSIHGKGREQPNMAPAMQMLADPSALVDDDGQVEAPRVQSRFQSDRPGSKDGDPWKIHSRHDQSSRLDNGDRCRLYHTEPK
jgi:hypothetical protein